MKIGAAWVAAGTALAVLSGCSPAAPDDEPSDPPNTAVVATEEVTTAFEGNVSVTVPAGHATGGTLTVTQPDSPALSADLEEYVDVVTPVSVDLVDGELTDTARITFTAVTGSIPEGQVPVVMWENDAAGFDAVPTRVVDGGDTVIATLPHFSGGFLGSVDVDKWASDVANDVKNFVTGRTDVAQPSCENAASAKGSGVRVTSDGGDTVRWCVGTGTEDKRVLKIANNRRTYAQVTLPDLWKVRETGLPALSWEALASIFRLAVARIVEYDVRLGSAPGHGWPPALWSPGSPRSSFVGSGSGVSRVGGLPSRCR